MTRKYIRILKINMVEEESLEIRLRKIDETRNYLSDEIKHNDLMSEKYKKTCKYLNYVECLTCLFSAIRIKICAITAGIKKYKAIIKKKEKKHEKVVLLGKTKLDTIEVLISNVLIDSYISHDEFVSVTNVFREYYAM